MINLAKYIDHTFLKPESTSSDIQRLCKEASEHQFCTVFVLPCWVPLAANFLKDTPVNVGSISGFPLGGAQPEIKAAEAARVVEDGGDEVDMVMNIGAAKEGNWHQVREEIELVVTAAKGKGVKVIIESCLLTDDEICKACQTSIEAGAVFVKTSTGLSHEGATVHAVELMRKTVGPDFGVKASGGIRSKEFALELLDAGANRIGTSCSINLLGTKANQCPS